MLLGIAADFVVLLHFAFILFVVFGAFLVIKWKRLAWLHLPAAMWGALIEFAGWICPLTPLENMLRRAGGERVYSMGFVEHYVLPLIYPAALTRDIQVALGLGVVAINTLVYAALLVYRARQSSKG